jgi:hypothetical protein
MHESPHFFLIGRIANAHPHEMSMVSVVHISTFTDCLAVAQLDLSAVKVFFLAPLVGRARYEAGHVRPGALGQLRLARSDHGSASW